jgi:L,D-transpeptidase catalytic domain
MRGRIAQSCPAAVLLLGVVAALLCAGSAFGSQGGGRVVADFPAAGTLAIRAVRVRARPGPHARAIRIMRQFRRDFRRQEIFAVSSRVGYDGQTWYRISVPGRPNGRMGWIPAWSVDLRPTVAKVEVHRRSRKIDLFWHGKRVWHAIVAVGAPGMETPLGLYYAAARFVPYNDPYLSVFAVETSGYSKLTEWPGGGVFGIHGTPEPWLLGKAVSHGCIRVSARTARMLRRYVPLGTPIVITNT